MVLHVEFDIFTSIFLILFEDYVGFSNGVKTLQFDFFLSKNILFTLSAFRLSQRSDCSKTQRINEYFVTYPNSDIFKYFPNCFQ